MEQVKDSANDHADAKKTKSRLLRRNQGKKSSDSSSNDNGGAQEVLPPPSNEAILPAQKSPPKVVTDDDLRRYENYVGQQWTGICKWFNVSKGFGFVVPDLEEAKEDDVFVHQSVLQMPGFRSLGEGEAIQFTVRLGKRGLEAENVTGIKGALIQGHSIRPIGKKKGDKKFRCYNCGQLGQHKANRCKKVIVPEKGEGTVDGAAPIKVCYHCHSTQHLLSQCPQYAEQKSNQKGGFSGVQPRRSALRKINENENSSDVIHRKV